MESFNKAVDYLKTASLRGSRLGLERITELCRLLGDPQNSVPVIHVAGTNGKGSFGAMISSVLSHSGYTTGSFSSPALLGVTDSFRINGEEITNEEFGELICGIIPVCESMSDKPTEFEVLTAAAYLLFARKKCDIAVVECGMGGETDSTNIVASPLLSVITNVAIDHTSFLGGTVEEIAAVKAGIIKKFRPVIYGGNDPAAQRVIRNKAAECSADLIVTDHSMMSEVRSDIDGTSLKYGDFGEIHTSLTGTYQQFNIANVLTAVTALRSMGLNIPDSAVRSGMESVRWHGRFEVISRQPLIVFDGAHNPDGIRSAAESIKRYFDGKVALLIGVMADKEYQLYPEILGKFVDCAFAVEPDNPRALDSCVLAGAFSCAGIPSAAFHELEEGVKQAVEYAKNRGIPLVALGSLYMYREFRSVLDQKNR